MDDFLEAILDIFVELGFEGKENKGAHKILRITAKIIITLLIIAMIALLIMIGILQLKTNILSGVGFITLGVVLLLVTLIRIKTKRE